MSAHKTITFLLPAFNEAPVIAQVIENILNLDLPIPLDRKVLVIDDGSHDGTAQIMDELCHNNNKIQYIQLSRNFGKEAAISAGLAATQSDAVILMDADGQHPEELITTFISHWQAGAQVVYGVQNQRVEDKFQHTGKRWFYHLLDASSNVDIPPNAGDFRLMDRIVVEALNQLPERNRYMKGLYAWVGFRAVAVPFAAKPRLAGQTHYGWKQLVSLGLTALTAFSITPLRFVSLLGMIISTASILYGLILLIEYFTSSSTLPGWTTLSVGMMFFSGIQLIALGLIAEYIGRIFNEVKGRPLYFVAKQHNIDMPTSTHLPVKNQHDEHSHT